MIRISGWNGNDLTAEQKAADLVENCFSLYCPVAGTTEQIRGIAIEASLIMAHDCRMVAEQANCMELVTFYQGVAAELNKMKVRNTMLQIVNN